MTVTMPERFHPLCRWCGDVLTEDDDNYWYGEWCGEGHQSCHARDCEVCR